MSLAIFALTFAYGLNKFKVMINYEDTRFTEVIGPNELNMTKVYEQNETKINYAISLMDL